MARILLIDDEEMIRELYREVLELYGHEVLCAGNGNEALALFDDSVRLVITDMNMPRKSGLETAKSLRERVPTLPIIGMSGEPNRMQELRDFAQDKGISVFLSKPFTPDDLCQAVAHLLSEPMPALIP